MRLLSRFTGKDYKTVQRTAPAVLAALALLFVPPVARTDDSDEQKPTAITDCGTVITAPGRYFLASDLKECPDFGISITVSRVKVEFRGHTIQATGGDNAINAKGGDTGLFELDIEGPGTVTGGIAGISLGNVHHSRVRGLVLVRNTFGMAVNSGDFTSEATVATTVSTDNEISDNVATGNVGHGITVNGGDENRFLRNNLSNNGSHGLYLFAASNNVARGNTADANGQSGIDAGTFGSGNQIDANIALGNGGPDLNDENGDCTRNAWSNNSFGSNSPTCIQ